MSRVLVVSRTRMNQGCVCVGGHDLDDDFRSLRLLTKASMNIEEDAGIDVGEVWELSYKDHPEPDPPHREDVLVSEGKKVDALSQKARYLYAGSSELNAFSWAGMTDPPPRISPETLVRVSLARWHDPASAPPGYYTQISDVF